MEELIIFLFLVTVGYLAGSAAEKRHYKKIEKKERNLSSIPVVTLSKKWTSEKEVESAELVLGSVVISIDYFKRFLAGLRNLFGGEVGAYESLVDRARREAVIRMKEKAFGADIILNMRIETSTIGQRATSGQSIGSVEALCYGTAIKLKK